MEPKVNEEKLVLENEWGIIRYVEDGNYIHHTIYQDVNLQDVRDFLETGLEALIEYGANKWLSDDRKNGPVNPEDVIWSNTVWGPRAAANGWKYWALVVPEAVAGRATMIDVVDAYFHMGVRVQTFSDLELAKAWLKKFD